jgi:hypothetical protein
VELLPLVYLLVSVVEGDNKEDRWWLAKGGGAHGSGCRNLYASTPRFRIDAIDGQFIGRYVLLKTRLDTNGSTSFTECLKYSQHRYFCN